ncbi:MAG: prepilin-type N-terminal cleavage/methylation domain-containing protein [Acidobacteria bacterium]|nr:prepilin-type N-terminal cleavage/methylation domain-containing protein [Acidobacteriota bacterium]
MFSRRSGRETGRDRTAPAAGPLRIHGHGGFTLLELALVMLIMSLAVAVTYPNLARGTAAFHLRATARDIMNTMRYAREKAITEQKTILVSADSEKQQVLLMEFPDGQARVYSLPEGVKIVRTWMYGQEALPGPLMVRFLPNGSSEAAEILLQADSGSQARVVTDPLAGGARVMTGPREGQP